MKREDVMREALPYSRIMHMVIHMKTTLNIDDTVMQRLREEAVRRGCTMSELVEAGLRRILDEPSMVATELPPLPTWKSGGALIDVADREALFDLFDSEEVLWGARPAPASWKSLPKLSDADKG
jgi:hypothetical protein